MAMDRRDFVQFLAAIAAGMSAMPEQLAAFEKYYEANVPNTSEELVSVDEIWMCGTASKSTILSAVFFPESKWQTKLAINAFGGILRWYAMPDQKIVLPASNLTWNVKSSPEQDLSLILTGHISYVDQRAVRHMISLEDPARGYTGVFERHDVIKG
jgi:hypothetical protein